MAGRLNPGVCMCAWACSYHQFSSPHVALYDCFQPSPYLRLLESQRQPGNKHGQLETQHIQVQSLYHCSIMDDQSGFQSPETRLTCQTTESWCHHQGVELSGSEPQASLQCFSVSATQLSTLKHVLIPEEQPSVPFKSSETLLISTPALGGMLQRLKILEDDTAQVNAAQVRLPSEVFMCKKVECFCMLLRWTQWPISGQFEETILIRCFIKKNNIWFIVYL